MVRRRGVAVVDGHLALERLVADGSGRCGLLIEYHHLGFVVPRLQHSLHFDLRPQTSFLDQGHFLVLTKAAAPLPPSLIILSHSLSSIPSQAKQISTSSSVSMTQLILLKQQMPQTIYEI
jgi:hypothetical protein